MCRGEKREQRPGLNPRWRSWLVAVSEDNGPVPRISEDARMVSALL